MAHSSEQPVPVDAWRPPLARALRPGVLAASEQLLAATRAAVAASPDNPPEASDDDAFVAQIAARELLATAGLSPMAIITALAQVACHGVIASGAEAASDVGAVIRPARVARAAQALGAAISWGLNSIIADGEDVSGVTH